MITDAQAERGQLTEPDYGPSLADLQELAEEWGVEYEGLDAEELEEVLEYHAEDRGYNSQNER